jgi:hypothetical protein
MSPTMESQVRDAIRVQHSLEASLREVFTLSVEPRQRLYSSLEWEPQASHDIPPRSFRSFMHTDGMTYSQAMTRINSKGYARFANIHEYVQLIVDGDDRSIQARDPEGVYDSLKSGQHAEFIGTAYQVKSQRTSHDWEIEYTFYHNPRGEIRGDCFLPSPFSYDSREHLSMTLPLDLVGNSRRTLIADGISGHRPLGEFLFSGTGTNPDQLAPCVLFVDQFLGQEIRRSFIYPLMIFANARPTKSNTYPWIIAPKVGIMGKEFMGQPITRYGDLSIYASSRGVI